MTPAEYIELIQNEGIVGTGHIMNFITILFAYLITAYFAGEKLSLFQARALTAIYSVFELLAVVTVEFSLRNNFLLRDQFRLEHPDVGNIYYPDLGIGPYWQLTIALIFLFAWVLSLMFMARMRSPGGSLHEKN